MQINEECTKCSACLDTCPVSAIIVRSSYFGWTYYINDDCTDCGACVDTCPVEAIVEG